MIVQQGILTFVVGQRLLNSIESITNQVEPICTITIETHMISCELVSASPSTATAYDLEESTDRIRSDRAGPPCHRRLWVVDPSGLHASHAGLTVKISLLLCIGN